MTLPQAIELFRDHQKTSARTKTRESYGYLFRNPEALFGGAALEGISFQDLYQSLVEGCHPAKSKNAKGVPLAVPPEYSG